MEITIFKEINEKNMRRIQRLRLFDDEFMTRCFEGSPECVELLLHIILGKPDLRVIEAHTQYFVKNLQGRSVRLDILAVDGAGVRYNIEIQLEDKGAGAKRARYHSGLIDANILLSGDDVANLPDTYVIFITEHDVLGGNLPVYHVERSIRELGKTFGDGSHIIYVNGSWRDESPIGKLMHDFSCTSAAEMHYPQLADRVRYFKEDVKGVQTMCKIWEEVRDEGIQQGIEVGAEKKQLDNIKALMKNLGFSIEQAMEALGVSDADRASVVKKLGLEL